MRSLVLVAFFLSLAWTQTVNVNNAKFSKTDGSISISTNGVWMSLQWADLTEYGPNGNVIQSVSLSGRDFGWSQPDVTPLIVDLNVTKEHFPAVNFTHRLINGAWFNVTAWLINTDSNWTSAKHNDVKWNINIGDWPWLGAIDREQPSGNLVLHAGLVGFGGVVRRQSNKETKGVKATASTAAFGNGLLSCPLQAMYDGWLGPVEVTHSLSGKPEVFWRFGYFASTLNYDPTVSPTTSTATGTAPTNVKAPSNPVATSGTARFNGDGSFGIATNGNWMALQWATLSEVDSNGNVLQSVDLSGHHFGWSQPTVTPIVDVNRVATTEHFPAVNFTQQLVNGAWFNVSAWIRDTDPVNAKNKRGAVKFSVYIGDWPWIGSSNSEIPANLVLTAGLVGFGGVVRSTDKRADAHNLLTVTYGYGFMASPMQASYDGTLGPVGVSHTLSGKPTVSWSFGSFYDYVSFDPDIESIPPGAPANVWRADGPAMISIYTILGVLLIGGLVLGIYFTTRVKQNRRDSTAARMQAEVDLARSSVEVDSDRPTTSV